MLRRGFTLLELIVVIIIIGILAALALPNFGKAKEHALGKEATANLKLIAAAERIYRMEDVSNAYGACQCLCSGTAATCCNNTKDGCNYLLKLSLNTQNWTYWVNTTVGPPPTFTATADRNGKDGYLDCRYSINQTQDEPVVAIGPCP